VKLVYLAGPYTGQTEWAIEENIRRAEGWAASLWLEGAAVLCPQKNSAHFGGLRDYETFLAGSLVMLKRCDCVALFPGWEQSRGAILERGYALDHGMRVFDLDNTIQRAAFLAWLREPVADEADEEAIIAAAIERMQCGATAGQQAVCKLPSGHAGPHEDPAEGIWDLNRDLAP
jgi:hypothetical protein